MPELQVHLGDEDDYRLRHLPPRFEGDTDLWILHINQEFGGKVLFYSSDGFDNFVRKISKLWAEGGGRISGRPDDGES